MLKIIPLPALKDNYIWVVVNDPLGQAVVVDPGEASPVLDFLNQHSLKLAGILATHKHADHTGGIRELVDACPRVAVYGHPAENIPFVTHPVTQGEMIAFDQWPDAFSVIPVPGHTLGHVAFYAHPMLFSGDMLFGAGCGRQFEGTAEQMLSSLEQLAALPPDTEVYCGHEYTLANLQFALHIEPANEDIKQRIEQTETLRRNHQPSLPSTMGLEKKTNPFLRCRQKSVILRVENEVGRKGMSTVEVFHALREWKNNF
ncbi:MAG TPA: hydroxyacylglutathione hydrolase [Gammaproteobacteria bacterium]|nr:hydroxyacylglutathione hydrolase [Gammaproteobacteria bacterium]